MSIKQLKDGRYQVDVRPQGGGRKADSKNLCPEIKGSGV
ncbi:integrase domain protein [Escherichia coli 5-366-08_S4_C1]|nr:integrase domain protein [Escherichia coli 5-366-08_S4_C1]